MHSDRPKVLHSLLGEPMLAHVLRNLGPVFGQNVRAIVGFGAEKVRERFPDLRCILQEEQLGTGHAVRQALPAVREEGFSHVLVINGDAPLISTDLLEQFVSRAQEADLAFATITVDDVGAYGRVVRRDGRVTAIVEAKDYDDAVYGAPTGEINAGLYLCSLTLLEQLVPGIQKNSRSGEYYLTDTVALALEAGYTVSGVRLGADARLLGVNSPKELVRMEEYLRCSLLDQLEDAGVLIHARDSVRISPSACVEPGVEITGPCEILGRSVLHSGAVIESHCVIRDSEIAGGAVLHSFSHLDGATVGEDCLVGPYARLRPGAVLEADVHVGNFVEVKKSRLGRGAKANHLTYLGDAEVGEATNIGAGTITCNYDGRNKHRTSIGDHAFIGSNTALVAPVQVGSGALIGAGSTITHDVPENALAVARSRQKNLPRRDI